MGRYWSDWRTIWYNIWSYTIWYNILIPAITPGPGLQVSGITPFFLPHRILGYKPSWCVLWARTTTRSIHSGRPSITVCRTSLSRMVSPNRCRVVCGAKRENYPHPSALFWKRRVLILAYSRRVCSLLLTRNLMKRASVVTCETFSCWFHSPSLVARLYIIDSLGLEAAVHYSPRNMILADKHNWARRVYFPSSALRQNKASYWRCD